MRLPEGLGNQGEFSISNSHSYSSNVKACRLLKSLYGLKQASRQWNEKFSHALIDIGYLQSKHDYSLFVKHENDKIVLLLVYVDDIIITGNDSDMIEDLKHYLHTKFHIKDLGYLKYFLGIEVMRNKDGIHLSQRKYILDLLKESGMSACKPAPTPLEQNLKLTSIEYDEGIQNDVVDPLLDDESEYQRLIGKLIYLSMTRPDIAFFVHLLSQFMHRPKKSHWLAALRVLRYLKGSVGLGPFMSAKSTMNLTTYCDADWAACMMTRRSVTGFCVKLGDSLLCWKTKKQKTVSRSSCEAEYRSIAVAACEVIWITGVLKDIGIQSVEPARICSDSKSAMSIATNPVFHERTKHIEVDCHMIRDLIQSKKICLEYVKSEEQPADLLTKGLNGEQHRRLLGKFGLLNGFK